jgi:predicted nucleotidyltransferase
VIEVTKFVQLLAKGNPKLVEPLFAPHLTWHTSEWDGAVAVRRAAINKITVIQYLSYSKQKLKSAKEAFEKKELPWKDLYHALRLAKEATRIANGIDVPPSSFLSVLSYI